MARGHSKNEPSQRQRRVNELIRHALSDILVRGDIADEELARATITVTEVRTSPDLRNARVYVVPLGGVNQDEVVAGLQRNGRFLRGELARQVSLKYVPALSFELDTTFDESDKLDALLRSGRVAQDLG